MADQRIRQHITVLAARLMYEGQETEYFTAKRKAARMLGITDYKFRPQNLPSNREIRDQILLTAATLEDQDQRRERLLGMRLRALSMMRTLGRFHPALIGSVLTGHIRAGSDIDIHVFSDDLGDVESQLEDAGLFFEVERKRVIKHHEERIFTHIHINGPVRIELTVYPIEKRSYGFKSSITGKSIERATVSQFECFLKEEYQLPDLDAALAAFEDHVDRYEVFRALLLPLEAVDQDPRYHPEGDALFHSLQVFEEARLMYPYDEEFLLAALLHDVGKAIDPHDHVAAGLEALEGLISARTAFLIEHHMDAHRLAQGTLGSRKRRRLHESVYYDDLVAFEACDAAGRRPGRVVCELDEALEYIRDLNC